MTRAALDRKTDIGPGPLQRVWRARYLLTTRCFFVLFFFVPPMLGRLGSPPALEENPQRGKQRMLCQHDPIALCVIWRCSRAAIIAGQRT